MYIYIYMYMYMYVGGFKIKLVIWRSAYGSATPSFLFNSFGVGERSSRSRYI